MLPVARQLARRSAHADSSAAHDCGTPRWRPPIGSRDRDRGPWCEGQPETRDFRRRACDGQLRTSSVGFRRDRQLTGPVGGPRRTTRYDREDESPASRMTSLVRLASNRPGASNPPDPVGRPMRGGPQAAVVRPGPVSCRPVAPAARPQPPAGAASATSSRPPRLDAKTTSSRSRAPRARRRAGRPARRSPGWDARGNQRGRARARARRRAGPALVPACSASRPSSDRKAATAAAGTRASSGPAGSRRIINVSSTGPAHQSRTASASGPGSGASESIESVRNATSSPRASARRIARGDEDLHDRLRRGPVLERVEPQPGRRQPRRRQRPGGRAVVGAVPGQLGRPPQPRERVRLGAANESVDRHRRLPFARLTPPPADVVGQRHRRQVRPDPHVGRLAAGQAYRGVHPRRQPGVRLAGLPPAHRPRDHSPQRRQLDRPPEAQVLDDAGPHVGRRHLAGAEGPIGHDGPRVRAQALRLLRHRAAKWPAPRSGPASPTVPRSSTTSRSSPSRSTRSSPLRRRAPSLWPPSAAAWRWPTRVSQARARR